MNSFQTSASADTATEPVESLSRSVIEAVAVADGCDTTALPVLFDRIDPDALDNLFATRDRTDTDERPTCSVRFTYHDYEVRAYADGRVAVTPLQG